MRYVEDETHRQSIIRKLNHMQRDVLDKYHKKTKRSILQNEIIQKTDGWEFIDIKVGENYRDNTKSKDERLYCQCGAELKYQYQLLDKQSGELIGLGETCFEHYTGISSEVAEQIKKEQLELDEWLDDILLNVEEQQYLKVKTTYIKMLDEFMAKTNQASKETPIPIRNGVITKKDLELLHDFKDVRLPIPTNLQKKIEQFLSQCKEKEVIEARNREMWRKIKNKEAEQQKQPSIAKKGKQSKHEAVLSEEQLGAVAECRMRIERKLRKCETITLVDLYDETKEHMDILLADFDKQKTVNLIINSVNKHTIYNIKCSGLTLVKVSKHKMW